MKIQSPWMGRVRGSAGNMTGCKVYDKNVMRAKAFEVSNPNTAAQQTQRTFFAQLTEICTDVSEDQLRSLFGQKPKSMSRRNALSHQVAAANTTTTGVKTVDFSKINRIGNGKQMESAMYHVASVANSSITLEETNGTMGLPSGSTANFILVIFNQTKNTIALVNTNMSLSSQSVNLTTIGCSVGDNVYFYPTCEESGENVSLRGFGSFIIKTRPEKVGRKVNK